MSRLLILTAVLCVGTAPPTANPTSCGLYDDSPVGVVCFRGDEITSAIATHGTSWLVEFYSSWCGHCQHFAPTWKKLAKDVSEWSSVVQLGVIDCSAKESFSTCTKYAIHGYPTIKFFPPGEGDPTATTSYRGPRNVLDFEKAIVNHVESLDGDTPAHWPHFTPLEGGHLLAIGEDVWLPTALVFEEEDSYTGRMLMMDMLKFKHLKVYRTLSTNLVLVNHYSIMEFPSLVIETRKDDYVVIPGHSLTDPRREFGKALHTHLQNTPHTVSLASHSPSTELAVTGTTHITLTRMNRVSSVDVLGAISYIFRREVPLHSTVSGDAFTALLRLTHLLENALTKAYPAAVPSLSVLRERLEVRLSAGFITSRDWMRLLETKLNESVFPRNPQWHNCRGSQPHYRGYPCTLWSLAHTLTLLTLPTHTPGEDRGTATTFSPKMTFRSKDALNIVSRFIRNFFSCEFCREHFTEMSRTLDTGRVVYDGDAVLWLWEAHNTVNRRLVKDISSDPMYPKTPFPSLKHCPYCYQRMTSPGGVSLDPSPDWTNVGFRSRTESFLARNVTTNKRNMVYAWNRTAVLLYLWNFYHWNNTHSLTHREVLQGAWPRAFTGPRHLYPRPQHGGLGLSSYDLGLCVTYYILCGALLAVVGYWLLRRRLRQYRHFLHP